MPLRYVDETRLTSIGALRPGVPALIEGTIIQVETQYRPRKALICRLQDEVSGQIRLRFLHFYPGQLSQLRQGVRVRAYGEPRSGFFGLEMVHPQYRVVSEGEPMANTLTPVYPTTAGLSQNVLRRLVQHVLSQGEFEETLPPGLAEALGLPDFDSSIRLLHGPPPDVALEALQNRSHPAWRRLAFDELLAQQISMRLHYARRRARHAPPLHGSGVLRSRLLAALPFRLTMAQQRAVDEIRRDLAQPHPMQRLLQGDVGSGKTIVAALAVLQAVESGWQVAVMAPTEILAEQHYIKFAGWLQPLGVNVVWLSGGQSRKERVIAIKSCAEGSAQVAVGTHALLQEQVRFAHLGLVVIDEQHRFGVHQRLALRMKGAQPHQLMMSATPIPRTLSMSYYADLDVSVIDTLPPGRTPVVTKLVSDQRRADVIAGVRAACAEGRQVYWVCPLVEESEALQLQAALDTHALLVAELPGIRVGLVHGRMKPSDKQVVMQAFASGKLQLLVATTVIEVGVDVPNASLMVIEHAERFGLSQLHQLRGRVGRGAAQSVCILLYHKPLSQTARQRLKIIYENTDGFEVARADLRLRGPGEFLGVRQSGVPMLKIADLERDADLLEAARQVAQEMLRTAPELAESHVRRWLGSVEAYLNV